MSRRHAPLALSIAPAILATVCVFNTACQPAAAPSESPAGANLERDVRQLVDASGAEVAVALRTLDGDTSLLINTETVFHAASTMKVPVMIELFRRQELGELSLDQPLLVTDTFSSIVDGSPYTMSADEDSEGDLYAAIGTEVPLRRLCEDMITWSSNLATNILIDYLGAERIQQTTDELGASGMRVLRGVEDIKAFEAGLSNATTAEALLTLFTKLGKGEVVSPAASQEMLAILRRQQFNEAIPAGLPTGISVAHKTGNITRIHHDAALVEGERPYALVVLVRGIDDQAESARLIAAIASRIHTEITSANA